MYQHCCICITILTALLTTIGALTTLTDNNHLIFDNGLMPRSGPHFQDSHVAVRERNLIEPYLMSSVTGSSNSATVKFNFYKKLDAFNFYKKLVAQKNVSDSTKTDMKSDSQSVNFSTQVQFENSGRGSLHRHRLVENRTPSTIRDVHLLSINIDDNTRLKTISFVRDRATGSYSNAIGLRSKSLLNGFADDSENAPKASRIMKRIDDGLPILEKQHGARPRFTRGVRREKRNSFWIDKRSSFLSNPGSESGNNVVYKNVDKWIDPLTVDEREMMELLQDTRSGGSIPAPIEANINHIGENPSSSERLSVDSEETGPDSVDDIVKDLQKMDTIFVQPLEAGNFYDDVLHDVSGELSKRDNAYKDRIYAFIKQGSRPTQRVSLQDTHRGSSILRQRDKMERSQHKKQPQKPLVPKVKEATCESDSDGTAPLRCPLNKDKCLYDVMICDGTPDCPQAEDEAFALCVLRHWTLKWFRKILPES